MANINGPILPNFVKILKDAGFSTTTIKPKSLANKNKND